MSKPKLAELLGVEVGELFRILISNAPSKDEYFVWEDGQFYGVKEDRLVYVPPSDILVTALSDPAFTILGGYEEDIEYATDVGGRKLASFKTPKNSRLARALGVKPEEEFREYGYDTVYKVSKYGQLCERTETPRGFVWKTVCNPLGTLIHDPSRVVRLAEEESGDKIDCSRPMSLEINTTLDINKKIW